MDTAGSEPLLCDPLPSGWPAVGQAPEPPGGGRADRAQGRSRNVLSSMERGSHARDEGVAHDADSGFSRGRVLLDGSSAARVTGEVHTGGAAVADVS